MYIKQIEIDNFKSFATKVESPLVEGFTTIVGPNGSGKSNIIDAVLFALGLQQARGIRAEKIEDLVSIYTKRNDAYVKVTFGDCENGSELSVARRIKKSPTGDFFLLLFIMFCNFICCQKVTSVIKFIICVTFNFEPVNSVYFQKF